MFHHCPSCWAKAILTFCLIFSCFSDFLKHVISLRRFIDQLANFSRHFKCYFFSIWDFFHEHLRITGLQEKGEGISLTPQYHFHPLHRHLDISRMITAESSPLLNSTLKQAYITAKFSAWLWQCVYSIFVLSFLNWAATLDVLSAILAAPS